MTDRKRVPALMTGLSEAECVLGLEPGLADAASVRLAYRSAVREHPPDRDPDGFRRVRAAYELLLDRHVSLRNALISRLPHVPPPEPPVSVAKERGATALVLLRKMVEALPSDGLLASQAKDLE